MLWSRVVATSGETIHRIWEEVVNDRLSIFDAISTDNGKNWSAAVPVADLDTPYSPIGIAVDPGGQIYLLQAEQNGITIQLDYWTWDGSGWAAGDSVKLGEGQVEQIETISVAILSNRSLGVLYGFRFFQHALRGGCSQPGLPDLSYREPIRRGPGNPERGGGDPNA